MRAAEVSRERNLNRAKMASAVALPDRAVKWYPSCASRAVSRRTLWNR
jgi:hypothetical protein